MSRDPLLTLNKKTQKLPPVPDPSRWFRPLEVKRCGRRCRISKQVPVVARQLPEVSEVVCESVSKMEVEEELLKFAWCIFVFVLGGERDQLIIQG